MRTLLRQFCDALEASLRPLLEPIRRTTEVLAAAPAGWPVKRILPALQDVRHHLGTLVEKVDTQQSYVACFGPLKSGKSTLLNALAGAWVSEVTALPAYPCMVFVRHAAVPEIKATRYDGSTTVFADPNELRVALERAHAELADLVRTRGDDAETFDPQRDFAQAIRRVDVGLPAPQLAKSGAVLVDSPGLFVKMRFGYDRMTKDFKRSAATAMFVVKTDNLFLEQVFEEFARLLELFSKVFLVVNLDGQKKDLRPDGTLEASLEQRDPKRIVEAFHAFSMDRSLKEAVEDGRLAIFPIDLQRAAAARLAPKEKAAGAPATPDFDAFVTALEGYINSSEYLHAFMGDSLRQGEVLLREVELITSMAPVVEMKARVADLRADQDVVRRTMERLQAASKHDWAGAFFALRQGLVEGVKGRAKEIRAKTGDAVGGMLDRWMASDAPLDRLVGEDAKKLFRSAIDEAAPVVFGSLKTAVGKGSAGATLPEPIRSTLAELGVSLDEHARAVLDGVDPRRGVPAPSIAVALERVPVKKSFVDWILFRSAGSIRRRLFGTAEKPVAKLPPETKAKVLGAAGREAIRAELVAQLDAWLPKAVDGMTAATFDAYVPGVLGRLRPAIAELEKEGVGELKTIDGKLAESARLVDEVGVLQGAMRDGIQVVESLTKKWAETDPALLTRPIGSAEVEDEDGPKPRRALKSPPARR